MHTEDESKQNHERTEISKEATNTRNYNHDMYVDRKDYFL
jgi:hypothetical protein